MVTFRDAVADSIRGGLCALIAVNDDAARLWGRFIPPLAGPADYFNFFAPLRADLCNENPSDYVPPTPDFTGGQCPGTNYQVTWIRDTPGIGPVSDSTQRIGPLGLSRALLEGEAEVDCGVPGRTFNRYTLTSPQGDVNLGSGCGVVVTNIVATPLDGPDNCGDPPIIRPEPGPITRPINITFNNEDNDIIDIDGDITFSPFFSVGDLNITAPFRLNLGGVNFNGELQISPSFELRIAPSFSFGGGGFADPTPILPRDPEEPEPPEPEPDEPVIIGVIVRSQLVGEQKATSIATENIPTIFAPRLGSVSFAINAGLVSAWTPDIDIKNRDCYIACPAPQGAVAVAATAAPGVTLTWVPVRGKPLQDLTS